MKVKFELEIDEAIFDEITKSFNNEVDLSKILSKRNFFVKDFKKDKTILTHHDSRLYGFIKEYVEATGEIILITG